MRKAAVLLILATFGVASCSSDAAVVKGATSSPSGTTSPAAATTIAVPPTITVVGPTTTTAPTTTPPPPPTTSPSSGGLAKVTILGVNSGAGSGEVDITVNGRPAGWTRFKVSFDGPSGPSVRADILDVQDVAGGTVITVISNTYAGGTPLTIAVSWVDGAGTTSPIAYFTCSGGIPIGGSC